jgi:hypothetical protein
MKVLMIILYLGHGITTMVVSKEECDAVRRNSDPLKIGVECVPMREFQP